MHRQVILSKSLNIVIRQNATPAFKRAKNVPKIALLSMIRNYISKFDLQVTLTFDLLTVTRPRIGTMGQKFYHKNCAKKAIFVVFCDLDLRF